jgi:hypothetical protein
MKINKQCRWALAGAVGTLLGTQGHANDTGWQAQTGVRYYSEDGRVTSVEPVLQLSNTDEQERTISINIAYDSLSGASPNGAAISDQVQTFTSTSGGGSTSYSSNQSAQTTTNASGRNLATRDGDDDDDDDDDEYEEGAVSQYSVNPGDVPLDPNFEDQRFAFSINIAQPVSRTLESSFGVSYSKETDYQSVGMNGGATFLMNQKNTQLGVFFGLEKDEITAGGGTPLGLSSTRDELKVSDSEDKLVLDMLVSLTQTLSPNAIMQANYSISQSSGYHTDPYKIISIIDADNLPVDYVFEHRPDERTKQSLYAAFKYHMFGDTFEASYRYMWDDWDVTSQTWETKYRLNLGHFYIQPHYRLYKQSATDFYVDSLNATDSAPQFASSDYRVGELTTQTVGGKVSWRFSQDQALSLRLERYQQTGESDAADMNATISQISYKWRF